MAATATLEVRARRSNSPDRWLDDSFQLSSDKPSLLLVHLHFDGFVIDHEWDENSFSGAMLVRGEPAQTVTAIHEFLNIDLQLIRTFSEDLDGLQFSMSFFIDHVACVQRAPRLNKDNVGLFFCNGQVLHTVRDYEKLARSDDHVAIT